MYLLSGGEGMSLGLATKGILPDFTGTGSGGTTIVTKYAGSVFEIETEMDVIEVNADVITEIVDIETYDDILVEVEMKEDDEITADELTIDVFVESNEIEVEINPCQA
jgi:hypothetical protein